MTGVVAYLNQRIEYADLSSRVVIDADELAALARIALAARCTNKLRRKGVWRTLTCEDRGSLEFYDPDHLPFEQWCGVCRGNAELSGVVDQRSDGGETK